MRPPDNVRYTAPQQLVRTQPTEPPISYLLMTTFKPWHYSSFTMTPQRKADLQPRPDEQLTEVPTHPAVGRDISSFVKGDKVTEKNIAWRFPYGQPEVQSGYDTTGDGRPNLVVTSNPKDPAIIEAVYEGEAASIQKPGTHVFAPFTAGTRAPVAKMVVSHPDGTQEIFKARSYRKISPDGRTVGARDFDGDGKTDYLGVSNKAGTTFIGYAPEDA